MTCSFSSTRCKRCTLNPHHLASSHSSLTTSVPAFLYFALKEILLLTASYILLNVVRDDDAILWSNDWYEDGCKHLGHFHEVSANQSGGNGVCVIAFKVKQQLIRPCHSPVSITALTTPLFFCFFVTVVPCRCGSGWWDIILTHPAARTPPWLCVFVKCSTSPHAHTQAGRLWRSVVV